MIWWVIIEGAVTHQLYLHRKQFLLFIRARILLLNYPIPSGLLQLHYVARLMLAEHR